MRLFVRMSEIICVFFVMFIFVVDLFHYTIYYDTLNTIVSAAVETTQFVIKDQIEASLNDGESIFLINSNEQYLKEFKNNLEIQNKENIKFTILVYGIDYEKGLLDVCVKCMVTCFNGRKIDLSTRKTSIIERVEYA